MANANTTNLNLIKPEVGADTDAWGGHLNTDLDTLDGIFAAAGTAVAINHLGKSVTVTDNLFYIKDNTDATKIAQFDAGSITTATTRTYILPDVNDTLVGLAATQTLSNKLLSGTTVVGSSDNGVSPAAGTLRGANGAGTNIAGATVTISAGNGTGTGGSGSINFNTAAAGSTGSTANTLATAMTISNAGDVGIGTTATGEGTLTVYSATTGTPATTGSTDTSTANRVRGGTTALDTGVYAAGQTWIQSRAYNNYATNYDLVLQPNGGNVGIGTASPGVKFEVAGNMKATASSFPSIFVNSTASGSYKGAIIFQNSSTAKWEMGVDTSSIGNNNFYWYDNVAATERGRWDATGNFLIGQKSYDPIGARTNGIAIGPATVSGSGMHIRADSGGVRFGVNTSNGTNIGFYADNGTTYIVGGTISTSVSGTTYGTSSDYRLKENVQPMLNGLATIAALRPVTYDWVLDKSAGEGFIAHELQAVIPFAVYGDKDATNEDGSLKPQQVDYSKIVVRLVAAIQELKAEFDAYKATHP
jgi:hypothetical protein